MTSAGWFRLVAVSVVAVLVALLGWIIGGIIGSWWPSLNGSMFLLFVAGALLVIAALAFVLALPAILRFSRCGFAHLRDLLRDAWPAFAVLALALAGFSAYRMPLVTPDCLAAAVSNEITEEEPVVLVRDKKEVSTDLIFDYNQDQSYSDEHKRKMDRQLADLFGDYDEIEIIRIVAHTDPVGSTERNLGLARRRGDFIRDSLARVAQSPQLKSKFQKDVAPVGIVYPHGPSGEDSPYWRACYARFYSADPAKRPLEQLDRALVGNRPACSAASPDMGKDGIYPACRGLRPSDAGRMSGPRFWQRMENFREMAACLAPMRHVVVQFNRARIVSAPKVEEQEKPVAAAVTPCVRAAFIDDTEKSVAALRPTLNGRAATDSSESDGESSIRRRVDPSV